MWGLLPRQLTENSLAVVATGRERQRRQVRRSAGEGVHEGRRQVTAGDGQRAAVAGGEEEGAAARGGELDLREAVVGEGPDTAVEDGAVVLGGQEQQRDAPACRVRGGSRAP